jgi:hypothetical protein
VWLLKTKLKKAGGSEEHHDESVESRPSSQEPNPRLSDVEAVYMLGLGRIF